MFHLAMIVASTAASSLAAAQAKKGDVPRPTSLVEEKPDPWWANCLFWLLVFSFEILVASTVGAFLFAVLKIAFAMQGESFPQVEGSN